MVDMNNFVKDLIEKPFSDTHLPRHQLGPDYVIPTTDIRTWYADGAIKLDLPQDLDPLWAPISVVTLFRNTVEAYPNTTALVAKRNGVEVKYTYSEYWDNVRTIAKGFIKLGFVAFHSVGILGFNSPEWLISYLAAIFAGGFSAGVYTTNSAEACYHVLNDCEANIVVVENDVQLEKILKIRDLLPHLKAIVQYRGKPQHPDVISWEDLMRIGQSVPDDVLERRIKGIAINQCCCVIYTSGTTGNPKGVMISHDNVIISITKFITRKIWDYVEGNEKTISYLPLSHVAALTNDIYLAIFMAQTVHFATPDALKGRMVDILLQVQPTSFGAVPRVYEKIYEKLQDVESNMGSVKRNLFKWAQKQGLKYHRLKNKSSEPILFSLAKNLVFKKVKRRMGLHNVKVFVCGGAALSTEIQNYFLSLDIVILEGYGLSESTCSHIGNTKQDKIVGSVGNVNLMKTQEVKILNPDQEGNGEILLRGRNIFMGYLRLEDQTKEALDDDRWLHSGDMGTIDKSGNLYITGRIKELIITSGGENIPPLIIEDAIKKQLPIISNCMVVGEKRKYLTLLITLKTELDMDTLLPSDRLTSQALSWCQSVGCQATTVSEILQTNDADVMSRIQVGINYYNEKEAMSNAQKIQKWTILTKDFSIPNGELVICDESCLDLRVDESLDCYRPMEWNTRIMTSLLVSLGRVVDTSGHAKVGFSPCCKRMEFGFILQPFAFLQVYFNSYYNFPIFCFRTCFRAYICIISFFSDYFVGDSFFGHFRKCSLILNTICNELVLGFQ
uniref:long-chain-fatty-acid--CoA ligase n=1 Tax=Strigamia maritima TaxID=126957 RepID=T1IW95_STRMM